MRLIKSIVFFGLVMGLLTSCSQDNNLSGDWNLNISNYKNSCGGKPTVAKIIHLVQSNEDLTATIDVQGEDGKVYQGTFKGTVDKLDPPATATLYGKFTVASFTTEETIAINFLDNNNFTGSSKWESKSTDSKTVCVGTQDVKGDKK